jgi:hypothetical protein
MTMINITEFDGEFEHFDDNGKRGRSPCRAVGVTDSDEFVVIAEYDGRMGTFTVPTVYQPEVRELRRMASRPQEKAGP